MPTNPHALWLAGQVRAHRLAAAKTVAEIARRDFPLYRDVPLTDVAAAFAVAFEILAESLEMSDLAPLTRYMTDVGTARLEAGAQPADVLALAEVLLTQLRALIDQAQATDPAAADGARRLLPLERTTLGTLRALPGM